MVPAEPFPVEVVHATAAAATAKSYLVTAPATVADVLELVAKDPDFHHVDVPALVVGIFGQIVPRSRLLRRGDRIELYRGPAADPKEARRQRAKRARGG